MGYVLFASRKLALTSRLNMLQLQLTMIQEEKQNLLNYSAAVADGVITSDEWAENTGCYSSLVAFNQNAYDQNPNNQQRAAAAIQTSQNEYLANNGIDSNFATNTSLTPEQIAAHQASLDTITANTINSVKADYARNVEAANIAAMENQLDLQMKKIETQISATQNELQSVEQAEAQNIQSATPKYAGLG